MLKRVQMTNYRVSRISKGSHTNHDFLEVPLIVIPNLFRDPVFDPIEGLLFPAFSGFMFFSAERFLEHDAETSITERAGYRV